MISKRSARVCARAWARASIETPQHLRLLAIYDSISRFTTRQEEKSDFTFLTAKGLDSRLEERSKIVFEDRVLKQCSSADVPRRRKVSSVPRIFIKSCIFACYPTCVMFCFHMPAFLWGKDLYIDTYLWPRLVSYTLFVRRNFVVCRHVSLTN
jgi:hypothetical protein